MRHCETGYVGVHALDFLKFLGLLRSAVIDVSFCPFTPVPFISVSVPVTVSNCYAQKSSVLTACSGGCWYVDLDTVLAVDPFTNLKPLFYPTDNHFSSFL